MAEGRCRFYGLAVKEKEGGYLRLIHRLGGVNRVKHCVKSVKQNGHFASD